MAYKVIGDSCCDFTKLELRSGKVARVPLSIVVDGVEYPDDGTRGQDDWIRLLQSSENSIGSACPSPEAFMSRFDEDKDNYVVTLSSKLSGSYNSAMLAKEMYLEDHEDARIHVVDSRSAAAGQHLICEEIMERAEKGLFFETIVEEIEKFRDEMLTIFVINDLSNLKKNGRLKGIKALVATAMNIKPVLVGDEGEIKQIDQGIGMNRAVNRLLYHLEKAKLDIHRKVRISQCDSKELCTKVAHILREQFGYIDVKLINANGLTTCYESPGGIVVAL